MGAEIYSSLHASPHAPHLCFNKRPTLVRRAAAGRCAAAASISGQTPAVCFASGKYRMLHRYMETARAEGLAQATPDTDH